jgi:hypothetical protein
MDINWYLNLVPTENYRKLYTDPSTGERLPSNFMRFMEAILRPVMDLHEVSQNYDAFNVNKAAGDQLDLLGLLVGIERRLPYVPVTGNINMTDETYRMVLLLRIAQEGWNGQNEDACKIYTNLIKGSGVNISYTDLVNAHVEMHVAPESQNASLVISSTDCFLVPAGVKMDLNIDEYEFATTNYSGLKPTSAETDIFVELSGGNS